LEKEEIVPGLGGEKKKTVTEIKKEKTKKPNLRRRNRSQRRRRLKIRIRRVKVRLAERQPTTDTRKEGEGYIRKAHTLLLGNREKSYTGLSSGKAKRKMRGKCLNKKRNPGSEKN